jgi:hypothetical protein
MSRPSTACWNVLASRLTRLLHEETLVSTPGTRALIDSLRRGGALAVGPDEAIDWACVVDEVGDGPLSGDVFEAICGLSDPPVRERAIRILLAKLRDPGGAQEVVALLCGGLDVPDDLLRPTFDGLSALTFERQNHYGVRAAARKGALYLAQGTAAWLYRLQGGLLELTTSDDPPFLRHAAAVVSVVASRRPDPPFVELLRNLFAVPEASDEAAFGLGLVLLAQALGTRERAEALSLFDESRSWFAKASANNEDRSDAGLFSATVGILLDFSNGVEPAEIQGSLKIVEQHLLDYLSTHLTNDSRPPDRSWIGLRTTEAVHWATLSLKLTEMAGSFAREAWLDGIRVIEEQLFHILTASRTLFNRTSHGGIEAVTGPRIETSFLKQKAHLAVLDEWLATKQQSPWHEQAQVFRSGVQKQLESAISRRSFEAASASSTLAALETIGGLSDTDRLEISSLIAGAEREFNLQATDPIADGILQSMIGDLWQNEDFRHHGGARSLFVEILLVTIKFVINCDNAQVSPATEYLFTKPDDKPLEKAIQTDYMNAIRLSNLSRFCTLEPQGIGSGRADVHFSYLGYNLVNECKRTSENLTNTEALLAFGGQLAGYQVSSVTFSALLVLDLYDRAGSAQNVRDRVSVETASPHGERSYSFAVFRVQGHRKSPKFQTLKAIAATNAHGAPCA